MTACFRRSPTVRRRRAGAHHRVHGRYRDDREHVGVDDIAPSDTAPRPAATAPAPSTLQIAGIPVASAEVGSRRRPCSRRASLSLRTRVARTMARRLGTRVEWASTPVRISLCSPSALASYGRWLPGRAAGTRSQPRGGGDRDAGQACVRDVDGVTLEAGQSVVMHGAGGAGYGTHERDVEGSA